VFHLKTVGLLYRSLSGRRNILHLFKKFSLLTALYSRSLEPQTYNKYIAHALGKFTNYIVEAVSSPISLVKQMEIIFWWMFLTADQLITLLA
jgi:hypothetical protein